MPKVNFLPTEFNDVKQGIVDAYKNDPRSFFKTYFQNYTEGGMLSYVIDLFAYITTYYNYTTSVSANEAFITSAGLDKNVYSCAKSLGYVPHRITASSCKVRLQLPQGFDSRYTPKHDDTSVLVPLYSSFRSNQGKEFTLMEEVYFTYDGTSTNKNGPKWRAFIDRDGDIILDGDSDEVNEYNTYEPLYFTIKQGYYESRTYRGNGAENQQIVIERLDIDDARESIYVYSIKNSERWEEVTSLLDLSLFTNSNNLILDNLSTYEDAPIYINNTLDTGIQLTFGDDTFGKAVEEDDILLIRYFITEGVAGNENNNFTSSQQYTYTDATDNVRLWRGSELTITIDDENYPTGSIGGTDKQTIDSIRTLAPLAFSAQDRIVSDVDYDTFIRKQQYVTVNAVKVLSGEDYYPPVLGGVVVLAAKDSESVPGLFLSEGDKQTLKYYLQSKCIAAADGVQFVDPEVVYVYLNGSIFYKTGVYSLTDVQSIFNSVLNSYFESMIDFDGYYKHSRLIGSFTAVPEIDHLNLAYTLLYAKRCTGETLFDDVIVNLGNAISPDTIRSDFDFDIVPSASPARYLLSIDGNDINPNDPNINSRVFKYNLYDEDGYIYIEENVYLNSSTTAESTVTAKIGEIDYDTGIVKFMFNSYELMDNTDSFVIMQQVNPDDLLPYFGSFIEVLIQRVSNGTEYTSLEESDFYLKFTFKTKSNDSFRSNGFMLIDFLTPTVKYVGEK